MAKEGRELIVRECTACTDGKVIVDWDAYNQLGIPIGYSDGSFHREMVRRAFGECPKCKGRGFVLIPKEEKENKK